MIMKHKRAMADMQVMWEKAIRDHQHEYDSDEEVDQQAGTWEHQLRKMEMEKTRGENHHQCEKRALISACYQFLSKGKHLAAVDQKPCPSFSRVGRVSD